MSLSAFRKISGAGGVGFFLPKGSDVVMQIHFHRNGRTERDRTQVGLYFAKKKVERPLQGKLPRCIADRWIACGAIQGACATTCDAIRSGAPYKRANTCP